MSDITVFSGSAHHAFAEEVCSILGTPVAPSRTTRFSNDCLQVQLRDNCRKRDVFIIQPLVPPVQENLVELLLMIDAARGASAAQITAVIPHFAYARSDKKDAPRISIGARLIAQLLKTAGADRVVTMALHSPQVHGMFDVPVDHLDATKVLADHFRSYDLSNTVVVSPGLRQRQDGQPLQPRAQRRRRRRARSVASPTTGSSSTRSSGDVAGKDVLVLDDEIATAGSTLELIDKLREIGVGTIRTVCTHGLFTGKAVERLNAQTDIAEIITTNTVPKVEGLNGLEVISVAPLFAEAIRRITSGESVSSLFSDEPTYG